MKASGVAFAHLEDSNSPGSFFLFSCAFASASTEPSHQTPLEWFQMRNRCADERHRYGCCLSHRKVDDTEVILKDERFSTELS